MSEQLTKRESFDPSFLPNNAQTSEASMRNPKPREELREVVEFPAYEDVVHGDLLTLALSTKTSELTHGLHRFPAKYIPQVPRWAIKSFAQADSVILDPFMGSGTTLVEALCVVEQSYGIDIDPLARLITQAKTGNFDPARMRSIANALHPPHLPTVPEVFLPMQGVKNITHWFSETAWRDLCRLFTGIELLECSENEREFFLTVFSSTLRWVSNADDQTQKTYVSGTLKKTPPPVFSTFQKSLDRALTGVTSLRSHRALRQTHVLDGSALDIPLSESSVDLIVTSPPYLDSVDYMYNFMLEYFWLGPKLGLFSRAEYNARKRLFIGAKNPGPSLHPIPKAISGLLNTSQIPKYRRNAVLAYFHLMQDHFLEAARVLKDGARYTLVVGNSQASTTGALPVHDSLLRLARTAGLHLEKAFAYRIRRHYMKFPRKGKGGIILMDWVIILRKTDGAILESETALPMPRVTIGPDEVAN